MPGGSAALKSEKEAKDEASNNCTIPTLVARGNKTEIIASKVAIICIQNQEAIFAKLITSAIRNECRLT